MNDYIRLKNIWLELKNQYLNWQTVCDPELLTPETAICKLNELLDIHKRDPKPTLEAQRLYNWLNNYFQ